MTAFEHRESDGVSWLEARLPGATAAFSARRGGASDAPYDSLNLGILTDDLPERVIENRRRLAEALGRRPEGIAMGHQVHGAEVQLHSVDGDRSGLVDSDVQVTAAAALSPLVLVADCFPLAVCAPGAVAMAHCGWRGTAAGAVGKAVEAVSRAAGTDPGEVHAVLGPGIGACCYEVGPEVVAAFRGRALPVAAPDRVDVGRAATSALFRAGVPRVAASDACTSCDPSYFSYRRDGVTGRQGGFVSLLDPGPRP